jgi:hypothetical protein
MLALTDVCDPHVIGDFELGIPDLGFLLGARQTSFIVSTKKIARCR